MARRLAVVAVIAAAAFGGGCVYVSGPESGGGPRRVSYSTFRETLAGRRLSGPSLEHWSQAAVAAGMIKHATGNWPRAPEEVATKLEALEAAPELIAWVRGLRALELVEEGPGWVRYRLETSRGAQADVRVNWTMTDLPPGEP